MLSPIKNIPLAWMAASLVWTFYACSGINSATNRNGEETAKSEELITLTCKQYRCRPNPEKIKECAEKITFTNCNGAIADIKTSKKAGGLESSGAGLQMCEWSGGQCDIKQRQGFCSKLTKESDCDRLSGGLCWWKTGLGLFGCDKFRCRPKWHEALSHYCSKRTGLLNCGGEKITTAKDQYYDLCTRETTETSPCIPNPQIQPPVKEYYFCEGLNKATCKGEEGTHSFLNRQLCEWAE